MLVLQLPVMLPLLLPLPLRLLLLFLLLAQRCVNIFCSQKATNYVSTSLNTVIWGATRYFSPTA